MSIWTRHGIIIEAKGKDMVNSLGIKLASVDRMDEFIKSLSDNVLQKRLFIEFGLEKENQAAFHIFLNYSYGENHIRPEGVLPDFFRGHRKEIIEMAIFEFDQELHDKVLKKDAWEEGSFPFCIN